MEGKIAHLGFIQAIISRMASNSFMIKGWSLTLISILLAIVYSGDSPAEIDGKWLFFPALSFLFLDAYYLVMERNFRVLYERVAISPPEVDFLMKVENPSFCDFIRAIMSISILPFHGVIVGMILFAT